MSEPELTDSLSQIETQWTQLVGAHQGEGEESRKALRQQLLRYHGAVYRYLAGVVRDPAVAEDLSQEFAVRFLRGDFKGLRRDFEGGHRPGVSFRSYLRTSLRNLARDFWDRKKRQGREGASLPPDDRGPADPAAAAEWDRIFDESCRQDVLDKAYQALAREEQVTGNLYHTTLSLKTRQPELKAPQLAEILGAQLGRSIRPDALRQTLHRARERFADLLLEELSRRLGTADADALEQELSDLHLLACCQSALARRRGS